MAGVGGQQDDWIHRSLLADGTDEMAGVDGATVDVTLSIHQRLANGLFGGGNVLVLLVNVRYGTCIGGDVAGEVPDSA